MGEVIASYRIDADNIEVAARAIAMEQSTGTWTEVTTATKEIHEKYGARVVDIEGDVAKIAFPVEDFSLEIGGIPNILSIIAGNLFGLREVRAVRLLDVEFPREIVSFFRGPNFGIEGIRKLVGTTGTRRPHVGTIIKPKIGLPPERFASVAYEAAMGGLDLIKDDETLANQDFCPLEERVSRTMEALDRAREEVGKPCLYAVNVTSDDIVETAQLAKDNGANCLMIDVLTCGFPALTALSRNFKLPIHVHRTMHGAITRMKNHGIAMLVLSKLVRMAGGDQLHVGCALGKMESENYRENYSALRGEWYGLEPVFPVCSGGVHPGYVEGNIRAGGKDIVIQAGGGVHGHPGGTRAGAKAMMQAVEAVMKGVSLEEYAREHEELRLALEKWGTQQITQYYGEER
ncbi:RuBisCO large subunit C-terminal-like domain-containing protein [Candidatus Pyrohabitans sp.]